MFKSYIKTSDISLLSLDTSFTHLKLAEIYNFRLGDGTCASSDYIY